MHAPGDGSPGGTEMLVHRTPPPYPLLEGPPDLRSTPRPDRLLQSYGPRLLMERGRKSQDRRHPPGFVIRTPAIEAVEQRPRFGPLRPESRRSCRQPSGMHGSSPGCTHEHPATGCPCIYPVTIPLPTPPIAVPVPAGEEAERHAPSAGFFQHFESRQMIAHQRAAAPTMRNTTSEIIC